MSTHAFRHHPRIKLTDHQKAKLFLDRKGRCHKCRRKLGSSDTWIVEHVIALSAGGDNAESNLDITCSWCLPVKNREDAAIAAKGRAVAVRHIIPTSQRQTKGKPMPGSKRSRWKHKMSGGWERRG